MARRFDIDINISTDNAEQKIKNLNKKIQKTFTDGVSASDTVGVFKNLVSYIAQIDKQLMHFKSTSGEGVFAKVFGGLDSNLTKETERLFGVAREQILEIEKLKERVSKAKTNPSIISEDELKKIEETVRSLYVAAGASSKDAGLSGKGKFETRLDKLMASLNNFGAVYENLNNRVAQGFNFDLTIKDFENQAKQAKQRIGELQTEIDKAMSSKSLKGEDISGYIVKLTELSTSFKNLAQSAGMSEDEIKNVESLVASLSQSLNDSLSKMLKQKDKNPISAFYQNAAKDVKASIDEIAKLDKLQAAKDRNGVKLDAFDKNNPSDLQREYIVEAFREYKQNAEAISKIDMSKNAEEGIKLLERQLQLIRTIGNARIHGAKSQDYASMYGLTGADASSFNNLVEDKASKNMALAYSNLAKAIEDRRKILVNAIAGENQELKELMSVNNTIWQEFLTGKGDSLYNPNNVNKSISDDLNKRAVKNVEAQKLKTLFDQSIKEFTDTGLINITGKEQEAYKGVLDKIRDNIITTVDECREEFAKLANLNYDELIKKNEELKASLAKQPEAGTGTGSGQAGGASGQIKSDVDTAKDKLKELEKVQNEYVGIIDSFNKKKKKTNINVTKQNDATVLRQQLKALTQANNDFLSAKNGTEEQIKAYGKLIKAAKDYQTVVDFIKKSGSNTAKTLVAGEKYTEASTVASNYLSGVGSNYSNQVKSYYEEMLRIVSNSIAEQNKLLGQQLSTEKAITGEVKERVETRKQENTIAADTNKVTGKKQNTGSKNKTSDAIPTNTGTGATKTGTGTQSTGANTSAELTQMKELQETIANITTAIGTMKTAFTDATSAIKTTVEAETTAFNMLKTSIEEISTSLTTIISFNQTANLQQKLGEAKQIIDSNKTASMQSSKIAESALKAETNDVNALITALQKLETAVQKVSGINVDTFKTINISSEIKQLGVLCTQIVQVKKAIEEKTQAFVQEGVTVSSVVKSESNKLATLCTKLNEVKDAVHKQGAAFNTARANVDNAINSEIKSLNKLKELLGEIQGILQSVFQATGQKIGDIDIEQKQSNVDNVSSAISAIQKTLSQILTVLQGFTGIQAEGKNSVKHKETVTSKQIDKTNDETKFANKLSDLATESTLRTIRNALSGINDSIKANKGENNIELKNTVSTLVNALTENVNSLKAATEGVVKQKQEEQDRARRESQTIKTDEQFKLASGKLAGQSDKASATITKTGNSTVTTVRRVGAEVARVVESTNNNITTTAVTMSNEFEVAMKETKKNLDDFYEKNYFGPSKAEGASSKGLDKYKEYIDVYGKLQAKIKEHSTALSEGKDTTKIQGDIDKLLASLTTLETELTEIANKSIAFQGKGAQIGTLNIGDLEKPADGLKRLIVSTNDLAVAFGGVYDNGHKVIYSVLDNGIIKKYSVEVDEATGAVRQMEISELGLVNAMERVHSVAKQGKDLEPILNDQDINKSTKLINEYNTKREELNRAVTDTFNRAKNNGGIVSDDDLKIIQGIVADVQRLGNKIQSEYTAIANFKSTGGIFSQLAGDGTVEERLKGHINVDAAKNKQSVSNVTYDEATQTMTANLVSMSGEITQVTAKYNDFFDGVQIIHQKTGSKIDETSQKIRQLGVSIANSNEIDKQSDAYNKYIEAVSKLNEHVNKIKNNEIVFDGQAIEYWRTLQQAVLDAGNALQNTTKASATEQNKVKANAETQIKALDNIFADKSVNKEAAVLQKYETLKTELQQKIKATFSGGIVKQEDLDVIVAMTKEVQSLGQTIQSEYNNIKNITSSGGLVSAFSGNVSNGLEAGMLDHLTATATDKGQFATNTKYDSATKTMTADLVNLSGEITKVTIKYNELFNSIQTTSEKATGKIDKVTTSFNALNNSISNAVNNKHIDTTQAEYGQYQNALMEFEEYDRQLKDGTIKPDSASIEEWQRLRQAVFDYGKALNEVVKVSVWRKGNKLNQVQINAENVKKTLDKLTLNKPQGQDKDLDRINAKYSDIIGLIDGYKKSSANITLQQLAEINSVIDALRNETEAYKANKAAIEEINASKNIANKYQGINMDSQLVQNYLNLTKQLDQQITDMFSKAAQNNGIIDPNDISEVKTITEEVKKLGQTIQSEYNKINNPSIADGLVRNLGGDKSLSVKERMEQQLNKDAWSDKKVVSSVKYDDVTKTMTADLVNLSGEVSQVTIKYNELFDKIQTTSQKSSTSVDQTTRKIEELGSVIDKYVSNNFINKSMTEFVQYKTALYDLNKHIQDMKSGAIAVDEDSIGYWQLLRQNVLQYGEEVKRVASIERGEKDKQIHLLESSVTEITKNIAGKGKKAKNDTDLKEILKQKQKIDGIIKQLRGKDSALTDSDVSTINKEIDQLRKLADAYRAKQEAKKQSEKDTKKFNDNHGKQLKDFDTYRKQVDNAGYITKDLTDKLDALESKLVNLNNKADLDKWIDEFKQLKAEIDRAKKTWVGKQNEPLKKSKDNADSIISGLGFKMHDTNLNEDQQAIANAYKNVIELINKQQAKVDAGAEAEVASIKTVIDALKEQADAYREKNDLSSVSPKNFGSMATRRENNRYNKFNELATQEGGTYSTSPEFMERFKAYEAEYAKLISLQKELSSKPVLTNKDTAEFDKQRNSVANLGKDLEKLLSISERMGKSDGFVGSASLTKKDADGNDVAFVNDANNRKKALIEYARQMNNVSADALIFDKNFTKCFYTIENADGTLTKTTAQIDILGNRIVETAGKTVGATRGFAGFFDEIRKKARSITSYLISMTGVYRIFQEVRRGITYVKEIDTAMTNLKKVTDATDAEYKDFLGTMQKTSATIGVTVSDLTTMAAEWAKLGYTMKEASELAKNTAILLNVSEFDDATEASQALVSTMQAFGYTADKSQYVVDVMNEIGNNYSISSDGIATALQDSASALMEAGNSYEQAVALTASANKVVQDPNSIGSALRTISLRLRGTSVEILQEMGEETEGVVESTSKLQEKIKALSGIDILTESGDYKSTYVILKEIGQVWQGMSDIDQAECCLYVQKCA